MNESINESMNEWTNVGVAENGLMHDERMNEARTWEWMNWRRIAWQGEWMQEWMNSCISKSANDVVHCNEFHDVSDKYAWAKICIRKIMR